MKKELLIFTVLSGLVFLSSCNNSNSSSSNTDKSKDTAKAAPAATAITESDDDALPSLLQIGSIIKNSELSYIPGLTNPISGADQYNTAYAQNLNLGIYIADLGYCTLNKKNEESTNYLKVVKTLADKIGMGAVFESGSFYKRYEANLNNEDSLAGLVADLQVQVDEVLKHNKQYNVRVIMYSGAWVENMYIGAEVYAKTKNSNSGVHLIEQMTILENMLQVLKKYKDSDPHIASLYDSFKQLDDTYQGFAEAKNYNPDSKQSFAFTDEHIKTLTGVLEGLHSKYIK